jgi:anti-sigma B factor antagonist
MQIGEKKTGEVDILSLAGRLDAYTTADIEKKFCSATEKTRVCLVVAMENLEYINSSGLRVLLSALKRARKQQGDIRLAGLQPYVQEVFNIAGFSQLFKTFEKEDDAINSFRVL